MSSTAVSTDVYSGYNSFAGNNDPQTSLDKNQELNHAQEEQQHRRMWIWAKTTGILYVIIILCGFYSELGVRSALIDETSVQDTIDNIQFSSRRYRSGFASEVIMSCADVGVSILLAAILITGGANLELSILASVFRLMQQAILASNLLHGFAVSLLLDEALPAATLMDQTMDATAKAQLAILFLQVQKYGYCLALIFFGMSMLLFGIVVVRFGIFPKLLGWLLVCTGVCYLLDNTLYFLGNGYNGNDLLMLPVVVAEFGLTGWLLLKTPTLSDCKVVQTN